MEDLSATIIDNWPGHSEEKTDRYEWRLAFRLALWSSKNWPELFPIAYVVVDMARFLGDFEIIPQGLKALADVIEYKPKTLAEMNEQWGHRFKTQQRQYT
jgi:hypothetical protein